MERTPLLFLRCVWHCGSLSHKWIMLNSNTRDNTLARVVLFIEKKSLPDSSAFYSRGNNWWLLSVGKYYMWFWRIPFWVQTNYNGKLWTPSPLSVSLRLLRLLSKLNMDRNRVHYLTPFPLNPFTGSITVNGSELFPVPHVFCLGITFDVVSLKMDIQFFTTWKTFLKSILSTLKSSYRCHLPPRLL